jgi:hypothetical protein
LVQLVDGADKTGFDTGIRAMESGVLGIAAKSSGGPHLLHFIESVRVSIHMGAWPAPVLVVASSQLTSNQRSFAHTYSADFDTLIDDSLAHKKRQTYLKTDKSLNPGGGMKEVPDAPVYTWSFFPAAMRGKDVSLPWSSAGMAPPARLPFFRQPVRFSMESANVEKRIRSEQDSILWLGLDWVTKVDRDGGSGSTNLMHLRLLRVLYPEKRALRAHLLENIGELCRSRPVARRIVGQVGALQRTHLDVLHYRLQGHTSGLREEILALPLTPRTNWRS